MSKTYTLQFGDGDPAVNTGLSPTFVIFQLLGGSTLAPPSITEPDSDGIYQFTYGPTLPIKFKIDGGAGLAAADRYITDQLDPIQAVDQVIGSVDSSFGSTSADPTTVMGHLKRNQEFNEGDATYVKSTGKWQISSRGASTLLQEKTLSNSTTQVDKS